MSAQRGAGRDFRVWGGLAISLAALAAAFYQVQWRDLWAALAGIRVRFVPLGILFTHVELLAGAWRWQVLLRPLGRYRVGRDCFGPFMIGYAANQLLPVRPGEILRAFLFGKKFGVSKGAVLGTAVVEKLQDVLGLVALMLPACFLVELPAEIRRAGLAAGLAVVAAGAVLWALCRREAWLDRALALFRWLPPALHERLGRLARNAVSGMMTLRSGPDFLASMLLTLGIWLAGVLVTQGYLLAFGLDLPWHAPVLVLVVVNLGMMIPSSPAAVGVAHLLYVVSLGVFGVDKATALAFGLVLHAVSFLQIVSVGAWCFGKEHIRIKDVRDEYRES